MLGTARSVVRPAGVTAAVTVLLLVGCSGDGTSAGAPATASTVPAPTTTTGPTTTTSVERPDGPAADVSELLTGGRSPFVGSARAATLPDTWVEEERVAAGTATSYRAEGELPADGRFELAEDETAPYRTRVLIRRPPAAAFNGTVVLEWLNVSGGVDANPDYAFMADEILRGGYAWVGVSAQRIGVEGGPVAVSAPGAGGVAGAGLKKIDADRYESLSHPGDAFSYDIYTQVARALRSGQGLGELVPERLLAIGESQSAFALTTYANGVQPLTQAFDGFFVHSRGSGSAPLGEPGEGIDVASAFSGSPTTIRIDLDVPVLVLETETDLLPPLGFFAARQHDTDRIRTWEVAGTAHADAFTVGALADLIDCGGPINDGPQHFVVKAGLRALDQWVRTDEPPPPAERIEITGTPPTIQRDADGNALGGVRTPQVDAPIAALSGEAGSPESVICILLGSTKPLPPERLAELYGSRDAYLDAYTAAADAAIQSGFVLAEDREVLLADAQPDAIPG